jgi:hypothetical protein
MSSKKILDDLKNALSITQASLQAQAHGRKQSAKQRRAHEGSLPKEKPQSKKLPGKNHAEPMWLARRVVEAAIVEPLTPKSSKKKSSTKKK